jgi:hypothetical protein
MSDSITVDAARLPLLLGELRLPNVPIGRAGRRRACWQPLPNSNSPSEPSDVFSDICWRRGCHRARPSTASTSPPFPWSAMLMSRRLPVAMPG